MTQVTNTALQVEKQRLGSMALTLTHMDDTLEPQVAAGSKLEVGGTLFEAATNQSITGWGLIANDTQTYVKAVAVGASAPLEFTAVGPTWSSSKQGFYDVAGTGRYVAKVYKDAGGNYTLKVLYKQQSGGVQNVEERGDGTIALMSDVAVLGELSADEGAVKFTPSNLSVSTGVANSSNWTMLIPKGTYYYQLEDRAAATTVCSMELYVGGAWRTLSGRAYFQGSYCSGLVYSDGVKFRLHYQGSPYSQTYWTLVKIN